MRVNAGGFPGLVRSDGSESATVETLIWPPLPVTLHAITINVVQLFFQQSDVLRPTHAALHARQCRDVDTATAKALELAALVLPAARFGEAINASDIVFGSWDEDRQTFTPDDRARQAVKVLSRQVGERANPVRNTLLGALGFPTFDAVRAAICQTEDDPGFTQGFVARGIIDIQSNKTFTED